MNRAYRFLLRSALTALGFGATVGCTPSAEYGSPPEDFQAIYGPPPVEYTDSTDNEPDEVKENPVVPVSSPTP